MTTPCKRVCSRWKEMVNFQKHIFTQTSNSEPVDRALQAAFRVSIDWLLWVVGKLTILFSKANKEYEFCLSISWWRKWHGVRLLWWGTFCARVVCVDFLSEVIDVTLLRAHQYSYSRSSDSTNYDWSSCSKCLRKSSSRVTHFKILEATDLQAGKGLVTFMSFIMKLMWCHLR